jgi:hypothetical protein
LLVSASDSFSPSECPFHWEGVPCAGKHSCQKRKHKEYLPTYLSTYLPTQSWYLPSIGTYHTQNGNRYVGKTSNQVMFLLQLVQKYFPTSSFFPDCPSARTTCVWCCPNTPFRACEGHLGTKT